MKNLILASLLVLWSASALAQAPELAAMNEKVDELELEQEVEDLESMGESARAEVAKEESKEMQQEAKRLEKEIARMQRQNEKSKSKIKNLNTAFYKKARLADKAEKRHAKVEKEKNRLQARVDALRSKVDAAEQRAIHALEGRKTAENYIAQLKKEERALKRREKVANSAINNNKRRYKKARQQGIRLSKSNKKLENRVKNLEARADHMASR